ncbi:Retrograde regulation protein 2 [Cyphellophora attinorum]|uniref:Retrograde regulation protein 2 n=1 Tax=Cyphellophora attinorum TaxID=1664694 RepID=A0A0N1HBA9_9EURO|nr:Retrograde regulation protein 2 [Phialophora attinorum]KPI45435.1 Retrograde regulation protein 2 [Phialophora attinorum]
MLPIPDANTGVTCSNGIRLSITDLAPPSTRSLPTVYQDRLGISLYDAQYSAEQPDTRRPIPQDVIDEVVFGLRKFKLVCEDFGVDDPECVKVLATEATRTALNSQDYRQQITKATGWEVDMLSKEDEGRIGAMGVASSFDSVEGLVMDLGGGSAQLTYLHTPDPESTPQTSPKGSVSFPYGAAALSRRLAALHRQYPPLSSNNIGPSSAVSITSAHSFSTTATTVGDESIASASTTNDNPAFGAAKASLGTELKSAFQAAFQSGLELPRPLARQAAHGGLTLYLSGGGFRGWGFLCMANHRVRPYPIPIINGFTISRKEWLATKEISDLAAMSLEDNEAADHDEGVHDGEQSLKELRGKGIFRVSKRRARQAPAVAFLVECLVEALPGVINDVRFCQGGVREGWLFELLPDSVKKDHPLVAATNALALQQPSTSQQSNDAGSSIAPSNSAAGIDHIASLLYSAFPPPSPELDRSIPSPHFSLAVCTALANTMYIGNSHPKETRACNALMLPLTGALASAHGVSHGQRAVLALALKARWAAEGSEVSEEWDSVREAKLRAVLTAQEGWWAEYLGRVAGLVGSVYPRGFRREFSDGRRMSERISLTAEWSEGLGKKGLSQGVRVTLRALGGANGENLMTHKDAINDPIKHWEKLGKKKQWKDYKGFGVPIQVDVLRESEQFVEKPC